MKHLENKTNWSISKGDDCTLNPDGEWDTLQGVLNYFKSSIVSGLLTKEEAEAKAQLLTNDTGITHRAEFIGKCKLDLCEL